MKNNDLRYSLVIGVMASIFLIVTIATSKSYTNDLEQRVADLEQRVTQLEQQLNQTNTQATPAVTRGSNNIENWRQLRTGMNQQEVERLLGRPQRVDGGASTNWFYSDQRWHSIVRFRNGSVSSWVEPR